MPTRLLASQPGPDGGTGPIGVTLYLRGTPLAVEYRYRLDGPHALAAWAARDAGKDTDRTKKAFFVPADEIRDNKFDLSINRYKETVYEAEEYDPPKVILGRMKALEKEILADLEELEGML